LLHTWPLGVEEQFYIAFPLLLLIISKYSGPRFASITLVFIAAVSFVAAVWAVSISPSAAFYQPWYRGWELLAGAILAYWSQRLSVGAPSARVLSWLGIFLILVPIIEYEEATPFPGFAALPPVVGAVFIIAAGVSGKPQAWPSRILSSRPFVAIGKISNSLYLWHWPPIVFARYLLQGEPSIAIMIACVAAAFVLAYLSYEFIEKPFRNKDLLSGWRIFKSGGLAMAVAISFGLVTHVTSGLSSRLDSSAAQMGMAAFDHNPRRVACDRASLKRIANNDICRLGDPDAVPRFALIGDSFGYAFAPGLDAAGLREGRSGYMLTYGGYTPLIGTDARNGACSYFFSAATTFVQNHPEIEEVFIVARWSAAVEAQVYGGGEHLYLTAPGHQALSRENTEAVLEAGLRQLLDEIGNRKSECFDFGLRTGAGP
jgi:hypothetical protein